MAELQSNTDAILVGIPMVGLLIVVLFRIDLLWRRFNRFKEEGHPLSHLDLQGQFVCVEPDGRHSVGSRDGIWNSGRFGLAGERPRPNGGALNRRVYVSWEETDCWE
jgi:hypothetical protein